jgi:hypothetical protein
MCKELTYIEHDFEVKEPFEIVAEPIAAYSL